MTPHRAAKRPRGGNRKLAASSAGDLRTPAEIFPPPRMFWWLPVDGQRHAIHDCDRHTSTGEPVHTLCGATYDRPAPPTDAQWLCSTCHCCWNEARESVQPR